MNKTKQKIINDAVNDYISDNHIEDDLVFPNGEGFVNSRVRIQDVEDNFFLTDLDLCNFDCAYISWDYSGLDHFISFDIYLYISKISAFYDMTNGVSLNNISDESYDIDCIGVSFSEADCDYELEMEGDDYV